MRSLRGASETSPCAPLRWRGPRSGAGVLEGKNRNDTQSRAGRRLVVTPELECQCDAICRTPFCCSAAFPLKGKRELSALIPAPLEDGKRDVPLRSLEVERATKWRGGAGGEESKRYSKQSRPPRQPKLIAPGGYHHPLNPLNPGPLPAALYLMDDGKWG